MRVIRCLYVNQTYVELSLYDVEELTVKCCFDVVKYLVLFRYSRFIKSTQTFPDFTLFVKKRELFEKIATVSVKFEESKTISNLSILACS